MLTTMGVGRGKVSVAAGGGSWSLVQSRSSDLAFIQNMPLAFVSNVTSGNLIVVIGTTGNGTDIFTGVTDTLSNSYARSTNGFQADTGNGQSVVCYYAKATSGGACTVTIAKSADADFSAIAIHEFAHSGGVNAAPFDVGAGQFDSTGSTSANADVSTAATTTANGDLIFGVAAGTSTGSTTWTAGTSPTAFSEAQEVTMGGSAGMQTEWAEQTSAGSIEATWTASDTAQYCAIMATFKKA